MLLLLSDEHIPIPSVRLLQDAGHDVVSIATDFQSIEDIDIIALANQEGRIIVSCDSDFDELIFNQEFVVKPASFISEYINSNPTSLLRSFCIGWAR